MLKKIVPSLIFTTILYIIPLLFRSELMLTVQFWILVLTCVLLLFTQPPISVSESKTNQNRDKLSMWVILGSVALIEIAMIIEWAYVRDHFIQFKFDPLAILGLSLMLVGVVVRLKSIKSLGRSFTATVRTQDNQTIVQTGVYKYIRHPSYLGAYLVIIGTPIFMHAYYTIPFGILLMYIAYVYRINLEEKVLVEDFGEVYTDYQKKTQKMIPFVY